MRPAARRKVACHLQVVYGISERRACLATGLGRSSQRYRTALGPAGLAVHAAEGVGRRAGALRLSASIHPAATGRAGR